MHAGFTGQLCEEDLDKCFLCPCINGTCINLVNNFTCLCDEGFSGNTYDTDIDDYIPNPCANVTCRDLINSFMCECDVGNTLTQLIH